MKAARTRHFGKRLPLPVLLAALVLPAVPVVAQAPRTPPTAPAQFDPADAHYQAFLSSQDGANLAKDGNYQAALDKYLQAQRFLKAVTTYYPAWKPEMVARRVALTETAVAEIRDKAAAQRDKQQCAMAELEGGVRKPVAPGANPDTLVQPPNPLSTNPVTQRQLEEQQRKVEAFRNQIAAGSGSGNSNQELEARLRAAQAEADSLRAQLARSPMESEVKSLNQRAADLRQERDAMSLALERSRQQYIDSQARAETLSADLKASSQKISDLTRDLKEQRDVTNDTVSAFRRQIKQLEAANAATQKELAGAHLRIAGLQRELDQSKEAYDQLRGEYDALAAQRDQLKSLLNLSEAGRIQELVEQNVDLNRQLREKEEKYNTLYRDNTATKDELASALSDLVVAKAQINRVKQDCRERDKRIAEYQQKLARYEKGLAGGTLGVSAEEVEVLRNTIKRQLLVQDRRKQATAILLETVKHMAAKSPEITAAVANLESDDIQLTPEEQKALSGKASLSLFAPSYPDGDTVDGNRRDQASRLAVADRLAAKAFTSGRYLVARECYESALEENPGNAPTLCKLGVVMLRTEDVAGATDSFRRATELDPANPFAFRMLGWCLYQQNDLPGAERSVSRSVELSQDDAKSQTLLGRLRYELGRVKDAELCFKAAIQADPNFSDPYFNLALICSRDKARLKDARSYYQQSIEHGAVPDRDLEKAIAGP